MAIIKRAGEFKARPYMNGPCKGGYTIMASFDNFSQMVHIYPAVHKSTHVGIGRGSFDTIEYLTTSDTRPNFSLLQGTSPDSSLHFHFTNEATRPKPSILTIKEGKGSQYSFLHPDFIFYNPSDDYKSLEKFNFTTGRSQPVLLIAEPRYKA